MIDRNKYLSNIERYLKNDVDNLISHLRMLLFDKMRNIVESGVLLEIKPKIEKIADKKVILEFKINNEIKIFIEYKIPYTIGNYFTIEFKLPYERRGVGDYTMYRDEHMVWQIYNKWLNNE